jgi:hypothetical protein
MMKKRIASIILFIVVAFLAWYMYQEYKKSQVVTIPTETTIEQAE